MAIWAKEPPVPVHVPGTSKGEEYLIKHGREPGREDKEGKPYRNARDSTSVNASAREPIDPRMPNIPPN